MSTSECILSDDDKYALLASYEQTVKKLTSEIENLKDLLRSTMIVLRIDHPEFETVSRRIQAVCKKSNLS